MWSRIELKSKAKEVLGKFYWKSFIVSFLLFVFSVSTNSSNDDSSASIDIIFPNVLFLISLLILAFIIFILIKVILGYGIIVGGRKYFIRASEGEYNLNHIKFAFKSGHYFNVVLAMLYRSILLFLWMLCLIVPFFVKFYAYRFVPFLLADNPSLSPSRAIELSNQMTKGEKLEMFVLDLSFIGWYILGAIPFGLGILFVNPYKDATMSELYLILRDKLVKSGHCSPEELNLVPTGSHETEESFDDMFSRFDD